MRTETIQIRLIDGTLPLPQYHSEGAVGLDLYSRLDLAIPAGSYVYAPLNVAVQLPPGYWGLLAARSSLHKKGLVLLNGVGIMDPDYSGDNDEYKAVLYNNTDADVSIAKGERLAQLVPLPATHFPVVQVQHLQANDRGGFGTTGGLEAALPVGTDN